MSLILHKTRFAGLGFIHLPECWRIVDINGGWDPSQPRTIGPQYKTEAELLSDLVRYAATSGYNDEPAALEEYLILVEEDEDETSRWHFACEAESAEHAEEQALGHSDLIRCIAVFKRVK